MRIITGTARGTKFRTLDGEDITRPTAERVKEALFSMIQFDIEGRRVLEPFGGTGQLALEALSRGAAFAVIGDINPAACEIIKGNAKKTGLFDKTRVLATDYKNLIRGLTGRERFDIVFLDPPYDSALIKESLACIIKADILNDGALVICESDKDEPFGAPGLAVRRFAKYGKVYITLLCREAVGD